MHEYFNIAKALPTLKTLCLCRLPFFASSHHSCLLLAHRAFCGMINDVDTHKIQSICIVMPLHLCFLRCLLVHLRAVLSSSSPSSSSGNMYILQVAVQHMIYMTRARKREIAHPVVVHNTQKIRLHCFQLVARTVAVALFR